MKVFLFQDTRFKDNHGCKATSSSLIDLIIKNGGTIIHATTLQEIEGLKIFKNIQFLKNILPYESKIRYFLRSFFFALQNLKKKKYGIPLQYKDFEKFSKLILKHKIYQKEYNLLNKSEVCIINAEGSVYGNQIKGILCFFWAYFISVHLKKPCAFVNHHSDLTNNTTFEIAKNVYPLITSVVFRDTYSMNKALKLNTSNNFKFGADAAFNYEQIFAKKYLNITLSNNFQKITSNYICIGGSSSIMRSDQKQISPYKPYKLLIEKLLQLDIKLILISADITDDFLFNKLSKKFKIEYYSSKTNINSYIQILENARCLITGRWHSSILAARGGTPIVTMKSNSKKMIAFNELFELEPREFDIMQNKNDVEDIIIKVKDYLDKGQNLRDYIFHRANELRKTSINNISILKER